MRSFIYKWPMSNRICQFAKNQTGKKIIAFDLRSKCCNYLYPIIITILAMHLPCAQAKLQNDKANKELNKELIKDASEFSVSLYSVLNDQASNIIFSPYSIYSCLSMIYAGARGETANQIQTAMSLNINQKKLPAESSKLSKKLLPQTNDSNAFQICMANGIWLDLDTFVLSDFRHTAESDYESMMQSLDFASTDQAIKTVNEWAANHTHGKITHLLQPGDVDGSTRILLTNAVYFKGNWQVPFDVKQTKTVSFFLPADTTTEVKMMENESSFPYFQKTTTCKC